MIELRPHHGMCFQFYEGKGYSSDFCDNMSKILAELEKNPDVKITLTSGVDLVCHNCPNNSAGTCTSSDKVGRYDHAVLKACTLQEGQTIAYGQFMDLVRRNIISTGKRVAICGDCVWNDICK